MLHVNMVFRIINTIPIPALYMVVREAIPAIYYKDEDLIGPISPPSLLLKFSESSKVKQIKI